MKRPTITRSRAVSVNVTSGIANVFALVTDPAVIAELRKQLGLQTILLNQTSYEKQALSNADQIGEVKDCLQKQS